TPRVRDDIASSLGMRDPLVVVTGFNRPNLELSARRCRGEQGKRQALLEALDPRDGRVLVYTGTRAASVELAELISGRGLAAAACGPGPPRVLPGARRPAVLAGRPRGRLRQAGPGGGLRAAAHLPPCPDRGLLRRDRGAPNVPGVRQLPGFRQAARGLGRRW